MRRKARSGIAFLLMLSLLLTILTSCTGEGHFHLYTSRVTEAAEQEEITTDINKSSHGFVGAFVIGE